MISWSKFRREPSVGLGAGALCEQRLKKECLFRLEKTQFQRHLIVPFSIYEDITEKVEPGSSQWCLVGGEKIIGKT